MLTRSLELRTVCRARLPPKKPTRGLERGTVRRAPTRQERPAPEEPALAPDGNLVIANVVVEVIVIVNR